MLDNIPNNKLQPPYAVDGDLTTRFSTGTAGVGIEWFAVDMCRTALVDGITLDDTNDATDQAAAYTVQVSTDGTNWSPVAMSCAAPAGVVLPITFAPVMARYIRVNQTGMLANASWWSIDELTIQCASAPDGGSDAGTDSSSEAAALDSSSEAAVDSSSEAAADSSSDATGQ